MRSARLGIHDSLPDTGSAPARQQKPRHSVQPAVTTFLCDVRHSLRTLRQHPGYVAVVVLTPGFGIGINTATFSIVNAVLIRPLEFAQPDRLVALHESLPDFPDGPFSPPDLLDFERDQMAFERVGAYLNIPAELSGSGEPVRLDGAKISPPSFQCSASRRFSAVASRPRKTDRDRRRHLELGTVAGPVRGRPVDRRSDDYARSQALRCRRRHALDFLLPPRGPQFNNKPASVWIPMAFTDRQRQSRGNEFNHGVIGRLKDGVSIAHARASSTFSRSESTPTTRLPYGT